MKSLTSIQASAMRDAGVRPMAKSLHTVSVLVNLSQHLLNVSRSKGGISDEQALAWACVILKLDGMPDPHGLKAQALKQLAKTTSKQTTTA
jgi:hypothetical protein